MPESSTAALPRAASIGLHALFFVSGGVGLVYEVLWMRRFAVLFGGTAEASAATLAGFFLGLAVGSAVFGRRSRRFTRPLAAFGGLEIGVAASALATMALLELYQRIYPWLRHGFAASPTPFLVAKLLLALVAIGLPAFFMGGTLPALAEAVTPPAGRLGVRVAGLYVANLLGAVVGALGVPFVLLPRFGARSAYAVAVGSSLAVGLAALTVGRRLAPRGVPAAASREPRVAAPRSRGALVLLLSAVSGAATLGLQVLWTRAFSLVHESSVYAFALVVAVFLVGLAAGAAVARRALRSGARAERVLGVAWAVAGILAVLSPIAFVRLTGGLGYVQAPDWPSLQARLAGLALVVVGPVALVLGMALPLLLERAGRGRAAGPATGAVVAANTVGAIIGPLAVTFLLAPALGLWRSMAAVGASVVFAGCWAGLGPRLGTVAVALLAVAVVGLETKALPPVCVHADRGEGLVSIREGSYGTTAVIEDPHDRWITVNNSYVLGGTAAAAEERWQAHLPLLLHPAPRRAAFLGLGTGITAGAALAHPVEGVVALEIVPEVVSAAREDFGEANRSLLADPRVRVEVDDGRHFLAVPPHRFEVIVGDLLVPWRLGEAALYTREHFAAVRRALTPDGVFCQWLPVYQLSEEQLRIVTATFVDVFPQTTLWRGNFLADQPILALVGHRDPRPLDARRVDERVRALRPSPGGAEPVLAHPAGFWLSLVGVVPEGTDWLSRARRNTDARPWLEILGPVAHAEGRPALFARGRLLEILEQLAERPLAGSVLANLDPEHLGWRGTGMALARAARDGGPEGEAEGLRLLQSLPDELGAAFGLSRR